MIRFLRSGGRVAWGLIIAVMVAIAGTIVVADSTAEARYRRDISRMAYNDNLELLDNVKKGLGIVSDSLQAIMSAPPAPGAERRYIVVSLSDYRLWLKQGDSVLFSAGVAVGSGKVLERTGGLHWRFDTPRGRLVVQKKELNPEWVPPDWHYVEIAQGRGLGLARLERGRSIRANDGSTITVRGGDVVRQYADGRVTTAGRGTELIVDGNIVIPPFGTNQRRYPDVLGTHRLNLGNGYAIHGTNQPSSIGRSVSHGCIRMRNSDIAALFEMVPVGTPVYIY
jgi:hypothetical protein